MEPADDHVGFASQRAWERWLERRHASSDGVWLRVGKKGSGVRSVTYAEAVESALCYGWIDGQARSLDDDHYLQRFTPRRARSRWSVINRTKAMDLIASGRMRPSGLAEVERAKADGRWAAASTRPSAARVPADLRRALAARNSAKAAFDALDGRNRYAILYRIEEAKRPETRARRIARFVEQLAAGEKPDA